MGLSEPGATQGVDTQHDAPLDAFSERALASN